MPRLEAKIDHLEKSINKAKVPLTVNTAAGKVGRILGNFAGQGDLGELAGSSLAKLFGHGDYSVKTNSLMASAPGGTLPKFSSHGRGTRIVEREFIGDLSAASTLFSGSTVFENRVYNINPTNRETFPWLSTIASQYDQWEPHGLVFEFISSSSEYNGSSQALGTVVMATDYDVGDPAYTSKPQMENADYACSTRPSNNLQHGIECDMSERPLRVLYTDTGGSTQTTFTSLGNFQVATTGMSAAGVRLGELWVSYDISFYKKQLAGPASSLYRFNASCYAPINAGWLAGLNPSFNDSRFSITQQVGVSTTLLFPPTIGSGWFQVILHADNAHSEFPTWTFVNCTQIDEVSYSWDRLIHTFVAKLTAVNASLICTGLRTTQGGNAWLSIQEVADR